MASATVTVLNPKPYPRPPSAGCQAASIIPFDRLPTTLAEATDRFVREAQRNGGGAQARDRAMARLMSDLRRLQGLPR